LYFFKNYQDIKLFFYYFSSCFSPLFSFVLSLFLFFRSGFSLGFFSLEPAVAASLLAVVVVVVVAVIGVGLLVLTDAIVDVVELLALLELVGEAAALVVEALVVATGDDEFGVLSLGVGLEVIKGAAIGVGFLYFPAPHSTLTAGAVTTGSPFCLRKIGKSSVEFGFASRPLSVS